MTDASFPFDRPPFNCVCDDPIMAKRNSSNVRGDLEEIRVAQLMLEHGLAINSLTTSDSGWDLHCHLPDNLILNASLATPQNSWALTGRVAHIQVKNGSRGRLRVGTVRGWITGTASGVPSFMFWRHNDRTVFSTPQDLEKWLLSPKTPSDDAADHGFTAEKTTAKKTTQLDTNEYCDKRFPSVLQLWTRYPQVALEFPTLTSWINRKTGSTSATSPDPRDAIIKELATAVWADAGYGRHTSHETLFPILTNLYERAGFSDPEDRATEYMMSWNLEDLTVGDGLYTRELISSGVARQLDNHNPEKSATELLESLMWLRHNDANMPS